MTLALMLGLFITEGGRKLKDFLQGEVTPEDILYVRVMLQFAHVTWQRNITVELQISFIICIRVVLSTLHVLHVSLVHHT